jgi:DNA-binding protein H-NS
VAGITGLDELLKERSALQSRIDQLHRESRDAAVVTAKKIIADFALEPYDLFDEISIKVQPKYRNPETGDVWSGRGKTPKWLVGKDRDKYLIK